MLLYAGWKQIWYQKKIKASKMYLWFLLFKIKIHIFYSHILSLPFLRIELPKKDILYDSEPMDRVYDKENKQWI